MKKDFIALTDFSPEELRRMVDLAVEIKARPQEFQGSLKGKTLGMIFEKKSTRTRISFEVGILQLGGWGLVFNPNDLQLARGETLADTARVLSRYIQGIMIRTYAHNDVVELARYASVPVINGLTDYNHPCQALSDIMTLQEKFGEPRGRKLAYVGDGNNMALSLLFACVKFGMHIAIVSPGDFSLSHDAFHDVQREIDEQGLTVTLTEHIEEGVAGADIVYTDVWASMGQEKDQAIKAASLAPYTVNDRVMAIAGKDAVFMHCLPAHRGEEVTAPVLEGKASIVFDQAENRLHAQKAIMVTLMK